ncbi:outer membrane lipoprotein carrier protein LolA [Kitasatospora sp. NPDC058444]|uniref:LolA family protein n=1 Tax=Kitasatospora sp. NPDC058444 TaxID=3346504 RepID=UPI003660A58B
MTDEKAAGDDLDGGAPYRSRRRVLMRAGVPVAVVAVIAAGVGLVPALAADGAPDLPTLTAEQLVAKVLGSEAQTLSGTVSISTDLGVPGQLLGAAGGLGGAVGGHGGAVGGHGGDGGGSAADPQSKLLGLLGGDRTLRVAVDGPDRQRVDVLENMAGYTLVRNGDQAWAWDSSTNSAVHLIGAAGQPARKHADQRPGAPLSELPTTPQEAARQFLAVSAGTTSVTVAGTAKVAGQNAYELSVKPTQSGSTLAEVRIAVAADNGVPLAVAVKSVDGDTVLNVRFTQVSFAKPADKTFDFTAPKGAKVTERKADDVAQGAPGEAREHKGTELSEGLNVIGEGWTTVVSTRLPGQAGGAADGAVDGAPKGDAKGDTKGGRHGRGAGAAQSLNPQAMVKSLGKPVAGGTLVSTKVVNVLLTDDGRVLAGAVTLPVLQHAAGVN